MKKLFIIHGWGGNSDEPMLFWLKEQSISMGFNVCVPNMPNTDEPKINEWVSSLKDLAPRPDEEVYLIGHSIGCQTILRYLETFNKVKIGGVILIAPWLVLSNLETDEEVIIGKPWIETPIDFERVKQTTDKFIVILSDDDPVVPLEENKNLFEKLLNPKIIIEHQKGHFTESDEVVSLSVAINELKKF